MELLHVAQYAYILWPVSRPLSSSFILVEWFDSVYKTCSFVWLKQKWLPLEGFPLVEVINAFSLTYLSLFDAPAYNALLPFILINPPGVYWKKWFSVSNLGRHSVWALLNGRLSLIGDKRKFLTSGNIIFEFALGQQTYANYCLPEPDLSRKLHGSVLWD